MGGESDPQALQDAIDSGIDAFEQVEKLNEEAAGCYEAADKISSLRQKVEAFARCQAIAAKADFILEHADEINGAQGRPTAASTDRDIRQTASDKRYWQVYDQYRGKNRDDIQRAFDQVAGQANTPSKAPALAALKDLLNRTRPHRPRVPDQPPAVSPPRPPRNEPDDKPDLGDAGGSPADGSQISSMAMRKRASSFNKKYVRQSIAEMMPTSDYWMVETRAEPTLHFISDCPACPPPDVPPQILEEPEHPLSLAERLGAHACGTCVRMAEKNIKDGFLYADVTAMKSLVIWRDRVEYQGPGWFGLKPKQVSVMADEITSVQISPTSLSLGAPPGRIDFPFRRAIDSEVAREAFRRLGWSFPDA